MMKMEQKVILKVTPHYHNTICPVTRWLVCLSVFLNNLNLTRYFGKVKVGERVDVTKRSKVKVNEGFDITEMSIVVIGSMSLEGQSQV